MMNFVLVLGEENPVLPGGTWTEYEAEVSDDKLICKQKKDPAVTVEIPYASFRSAEFGIGTNPFLKVSGNLLEDEKVKGTIHLAFGNSRGMGGDNDVPVHIDCVIRRPSVYIDGRLVIEEGEWRI